MKQFNDDNFVLETKTAQDLYHNHAAKMPIIDYHCHLIPEMVANDHRFKSITVEKWAETVPYTFRNPLYHWTHLELKTAFGITKQLSPKTAREIFDECNEKLQQPEFSARGLMRHYNVECVCTTDDPVDDLHNHIEYAKHKAANDPKMLPAWRPDKAMNIEKPEFPKYVEQLGEVSGVNITKFADMIDALQKRHDFFAAQGSKLSDHGIEEFYDEEYTDSQIETIFEKAMRGQQLSQLEIRQFKNCFLTVMAEMDADAGWTTQQFHYGAIRDNNTAMYNQLGADTGFDSIGEFNTAKAMSAFLNKLNMKGKLTRTILYTLNPCANEVIATMLGNFQGGEPGKIQFGSGWWFNDQMDGMIRQMNALSVLGLLSRFVGMLTDSRSFLSYPRHEYFRRILCNLLGNDVEKGLLPNDEEILGRMVEDISYNNARRYFDFY